jgi:hypothetical protein
MPAKPVDVIPDTTAADAKIAATADRTKTGPTPRRRVRQRTTSRARACSCGSPLCGWAQRCPEAAPATPAAPPA